MDIGLRALVVFGLVLLNAFFVAAEFAILSARRPVMQERAAAGSRAAAHVLACLDDPRRFVSTAQVGITMSSLALGWAGEPAVAALLGQPLEALGAGPSASQVLSFTLAFLLITFLHVVIGETWPKGIAIASAERVALSVVRPLLACHAVLRPFIWLLNASSERLLRLSGIRSIAPGRVAHSEEDLRLLVAESGEGGMLDQAEQEMLHNVFDFADKDVADVMVPRPDVVALPVDQPPAQLMETIIEQPYTRYPVYRETPDDVVGILHIRDLFKAAERVGKGRIRMEALLRPAHVVPESKGLAGLLADFRRSKSHMALVVDEYGSLAGIVTLEDLLEEIVGEIDDEHDVPERTLERIGDRHLRVDGKYPLDELAGELGAGFGSSDYHTIGGFVFGLLGQQPHDGDVVRHGNLRFEVTATDGPRIVTVDVMLLDGQSPVVGSDDGSETADVP